MAITRARDELPPRAGFRPSTWPLLAATAVSVTGDGAFIAAAPLLAASISSDPLAVSTVTAAIYLPWLLFGLPAGALADRWERRRVMILADVARAIVLLSLAVLVISGHVSIPLLVVAILVVGAAQCFFDSSSQALIPALVGRDKEALSLINGRFWAADTLGRSLVGPPIGAGLFVVGRALPFLVDSLSFVASAFLVARLPVQQTSTKRQPVVDAIREGVHHLLATRELLVLALSTGAYNFCYNVAIATFVLYAQQRLGVDGLTYGLLLATMALGGLAASWFAPRITRGRSWRMLQSAALVAQAVAWLLVSIAPSPWLVGLLFAGLGAGSAVSTVAVSSARQMLTSDEMLGRVVSASRLIGVGAAASGALLGGLIADVFTLSAPQVTAGILLLVAAAVTAPRVSRDRSARTNG